MKDMVLIPGTWARARSWGSFPEDLEGLGFRVHAPEKRYHDLAYEEIEARIGEVSLNDYVDDFTGYCQGLDRESLFILGHSLGGLIAQLVAVRVQPRGLILLGPAPTADIFAFYPAMVHAFYRHYLQWGFWKKPLYPNKYAYYNYVARMQDDETKAKGFEGLVPESGRVYTEMGLPFLDRKGAASLDQSQIKCPILVVTGTEDKIVHPKVARDTVASYKDSKLVIIEGADHLYFSQRTRPQLLREIGIWLEEIGQ